MLTAPRLSRPCVVTARADSGTLDDYGNPTVAETTTETVCELQQQRRSEAGDQGETSDTHWLLVLPPETLIESADTVTVDGDVYEVVGDPWHAVLPSTGLETHVEASLRRTT